MNEAMEKKEQEVADKTLNNNDILPFAVVKPKDQYPDLMYEIEKQLEILFDGQKESTDYEKMIEKLQSVANEARNKGEPTTAKEYQEFKKIQYEYVDVLSKYVSTLLKNEKFFKSAFKGY